MSLKQTLITTGFGVATALGLSASAVAEEHEESKADLSDAVESGGGGGKKDGAGNDPSNFTNKAFSYYRHTKLKNGTEINDYSALLFLAGDFAGWEAAFIWESPIIRDIDIPGVGSESGVTDWVMRMGFMPPVKTDLGNGLQASHIFLPEVTVPTGSGLLTQDTTILSPGYVPVISSGKDWFFAPAIFYDFDLDKGTRGVDVNRLRSRIFFQKMFNTKIPTYFFPEVQMAYDFETDHFSAWIAPEFGMFIKKPNPEKGTPGGVLYGKVGYGIDADPTYGDREWTYEAGLRFVW